MSLCFGPRPDARYRERRPPLLVGRCPASPGIMPLARASRKSRVFAVQAGSAQPILCTTAGSSFMGVQAIGDRISGLRRLRSITATRFRSSHPSSWPRRIPCLRRKAPATSQTTSAVGMTSHSRTPRTSKTSNPARRGSRRPSGGFKCCVRGSVVLVPAAEGPSSHCRYWPLRGELQGLRRWGWGVDPSPVCQALCEWLVTNLA